MFPGLPDSTVFTSCVGSDDAHIFLSSGICSPWSVVYSKQSSLCLLSFLLSFLFFFHLLLVFLFFSSLPCVSVKMDYIQLLLKVFELTWSDFCTAESIFGSCTVGFQAKHSSSNAQQRAGNKQT